MVNTRCAASQLQREATAVEASTAVRLANALARVRAVQALFGSLAEADLGQA